VVSDGHFFNNVFTMSGGNGVYIGYKNTVSGPVGYALSAMHLSYTGNLTIQGTTYTFGSRTAIGGSDLALYSFTHPSDVMPTLDALSLASSSPLAGTDIVMIGSGRNRVQDATTNATLSDAVPVTDGTGYETTTPRLMRWGTNQTEDHPPPMPSNLRTEVVAGRSTVLTLTTFDEPSSGEWLSTNEAQGVIADSGGGMFTYDGSLTGIMAAVTTANSTEAAFGEGTLFADIATYKSAIDFETGGLLIPELSTWLMMVGCFSLLVAVQRTRKR